MLNTNEILTAIKKAAESAAEQSDQITNNHERSRQFILEMHENFEKIFENDKNITVFSRTKENPVFKINEYLFDILVCEIGITKSVVHEREIPFIKKAILELESEFSQNTSETVYDFNKLVCGKAENYVMILPNTDKHNHYLEPLKPLAQAIDSENVFIVFVDHPESWDSKQQVKVNFYKKSENNFKEILL